jgi:hypothetical protein
LKQIELTDDAVAALLLSAVECRGLFEVHIQSRRSLFLGKVAQRSAAAIGGRIATINGPVAGDG